MPYFTGTHIFKADNLVIEKLKEQNRLLKSDKLNHSYPHSWRSKAPLIYRATPQWFISMEKNSLRNKAIKAIKNTAFYPEKGKDRLLSMIEERPAWCVSRQRVWGVPLPIFINKKTNKILLLAWNFQDDDETTESNIVENADDVKSKMMKLINIAKDGSGLEKLRTKSENIDLLQTFVSYCLIHFTTSLYLRYNACNVVISEIFTASDEALCILLNENNA